MKVLIYDDEAEFAAYVQEAVEDLGHSVRVATSAAEFAERFSAETDLIFLDLFMPDVNGIECIRFLANTGTRALLVLMSGQDPAILNAAREGARANDLTVLDVLKKPIPLAALEETLTKADQHLEETAGQDPSTCSPCAFLAEDARAGLARDEFHVVYQPQVRLEDGSVVGVEALIRWQHPTCGPISPADFIPVLEAAPEVMKDVTDFVLRTACRDLSSVSTFAPNLTCSINLSAATFFEIDLPERIRQTVREFGLDNRRIILEVTETAASSHVGTAIDILTRLRMAGFGVSIDDFGTGYSSLEQIVRVPFTELKVDQRFVRDLLTSTKCQAVCEISCLLAQKTNMLPLAEGVEDEATVHALQELGFILAQGFHFARPMRRDDLAAWLSKQDVDAARRQEALAAAPLAQG